MDTLIVRMSGAGNPTETVEGVEVNGFFVHRNVINGCLWTVSHSQSGMNLGANFTMRKNALSFATELGNLYNGHTDADGLIEQFKARGDKPSVSDVGEQNHMQSL
jgi:hypothetical protein